MVTLTDILACFPAISDWKDAYLDDSRQRLLGETEGFSVEIILGESLDHVGVFSDSIERPEVVSVMEVFSGSCDVAGVILDRARDFFLNAPDGTFHSILGNHTLTLFHLRKCMHLRISPSTDL